MPPFEHTGRAEAIRAALAADDRFDARRADAVRAPRRSRPCTTPAWCASWRRRGPSTSARCRPGRRRGARRLLRCRGCAPGWPGAPSRSRSSARLGWWCFETTTPLTAGTYEAAARRVDTALTARRRWCSAASALAYGLCRPPGHHATTSLYGGYCFFNNAAVAAHHVAATTGTKVTVLDVDYHHGNGTQQIFYERDDVQFVSLHGDPERAYPYNIGYADETGAGRGEGATATSRWPPAPTTTPTSPRCDRALAGDRRVRPVAAHRLARARHVRQRPDLRPRAHHRRLRPLRRRRRRARPADWSCSRRAATTSTPSATTSPLAHRRRRHRQLTPGVCRGRQPALP